MSIEKVEDFALILEHSMKKFALKTKGSPLRTGTDKRLSPFELIDVFDRQKPPYFTRACIISYTLNNRSV